MPGVRYLFTRFQLLIITYHFESSSTSCYILLLSLPFQSYSMLVTGLYLPCTP
ncbi:Protein of unknown function [Pyronema omphalodes CBS 100304]|uniref:Uncharacterized protein n=1 Tax=Pyronema omphalodes (strain CBS 100304) TaxID=1076935 RepID=U4LLZ8_PYROM|nr:Protein of unknown function [Pyronema omphalodes CBS 100304]